MKKGKKNLKKKEEEREEEMEEEEEGEEEEEKSTKSEALSEDDLEKSLAQLEALAEEGDSDSRKDKLLAKAQSGEDLAKSEADELYQLLGGESGDDNEPTLGEEIAKGFADNQPIQQALDVSEYLQENHTELTKSLDKLADAIEKSGNAQHGFNLILAKAVAETGRGVVAIQERLGLIERQPARKPKAVRSPAQAMEKGFGGREPDGEQLSKGDVLDALEEMLQKSVQDGRGGATEDGIDLGVASSKFEQFGQISPTLLNKVRTHIANKGATVH